MGHSRLDGKEWVVPYGKPRLCINIYHYAPPIGSNAQRATGSAAHRAAVLVKF